MNSLGCSSSLRTSWQFLPWGYVAQYDFEATLNPERLRTAAKLILTTTLPQAARSRSTILDMRGRDPLRESLLHPSPLPLPQHEELLCLCGTLPAHLDSQTSEEDIQLETFELTYRTHFSHFEGARHIAYSVDRHLQGAEQFNSRELELVLHSNTTLTGVRLGLELFEPRFLSIFGFSPIATQALQIEAMPQIFRMRLLGEGLSRRDALPLRSASLFNAVSEMLRELFDFDLLRDYQSRLAARAK